MNRRVLEVLCKKRQVTWRGILGLALAAVVILAWGGSVWLDHIEAQAHARPAYEKEEIDHLLHKKVSAEEQTYNNIEEGVYLEEKDYELLFRQTGMGPAGVDALFGQGRQWELLDMQKDFFAEVQVKCVPNTKITREERVTGQNKGRIPCLEEGDILVSFNCHALTWRNGHVGMVVDVGKRKTLEASRLGTRSSVVSLEHWEYYPSFAVLRMKGVPWEERAAVAAFAKKELEGIPYRLEAGILDRIIEKIKQWTAAGEGAEPVHGRTDLKEEGKGKKIHGTHCAHLTWYAYREFGYDIDSDGGVIVTPADLFASPLFEVVQIYGMSAEAFLPNS